MPSAPNTKSTAGESEDTCSDGNGGGGERPFYGLTAILQCSATPRRQRLGYFWRFLPLPSVGIARVQRSTVPPRQRLGCFLRYLPLPSGGASLILPSASPHQQRLGCFSRFLPLPSGDTAPARPSVASPRQRLGQFCLFLPLPSWITVILQHPRANGRGIFRDFHPYLRRTPPHNPGVAPTTCAALSDFKNSSSNHQAGLPYSRSPFSVPDGLASASRTGEGLFLYGMWNLALSAGRFSLEFTDRLCLKLHPLLSPCTFSAES